MNTDKTTQSCKPLAGRNEPEPVARCYRPNVDVIESGEEMLLLADMPGVKPDDLDIRYERGELSIHARVTPRQDPNTTYLLREYGIGDWQRSFRIGEGIDSERIQAELKDGVLTLHLPKTKELLPRQIAVKAG